MGLSQALLETATVGADPLGSAGFLLFGKSMTDLFFPFPFEGGDQTFAGIIKMSSWCVLSYLGLAFTSHPLLGRIAPSDGNMYIFGKA